MPESLRFPEEMASFQFPRLREETLGLSSQPAQKEESET